MVCIYCSGNTDVFNSRHQKRLNHVWRRRRCAVCKAVFTTIEAADPSQTVLIKRNGHLEPFSRELILLSVYDSLKHRKTAVQDATALTATIVSTLYGLTANATLERDQITEAAATVLERFDSVAAVHYRAFHS